MKNVINFNAKLQDNLEYLVGAHDFLIKNVIQLEDNLEKVEQDKIDLENRSKISDNVNGYDYFTNDKCGLKYESAVTTFKTKPVTVKRNHKKKRELNRHPKATKISKALSFAKVLEVTPFDNYKHKLAQPFWCEYCD